jgi:hypothetical protein
MFVYLADENLFKIGVAFVGREGHMKETITILHERICQILWPTESRQPIKRPEKTNYDL